MRVRGSVAAALAVSLVCATALGTASADDGYSPYEQETIDLALTDLKTQVDPSPQGKTVESIVLRRLEVLEERDPLPQFAIDILNALHATSLPFTIEREVLQREGQPYDQDLVDETARNLRQIRQISLVVCVPIKGSAPDKVRLLVITKDIWSLRLNSDFRITDAGLERLVLVPSEENLGGTHHSASLRFELDPGTYSFGFGYKVPRVGDSRIEAAVSANLILGRESGELEGTYGSVSYGQPLFSKKTEWAWSAAIAWRRSIARSYTGLDIRTYDADVTEIDDAIPFQYDADVLVGSYRVRRSFGERIKNDFSVGVEASRSAYRARDLEGFDPRAREEFEREILPVSDTRIYPFVQYDGYRTDFVSVLDFNTLGLQEDYAVGHDVYVKAYPVSEAIGSTRSYGGVAAGVGYTVPMGDGLSRVYTEGVAEADFDQVYDASVTGGFRLVTPRLGFGRLVVDAIGLYRPRNFLNRRSELGGDTRLRGYPSGAFRGQNALAYNVELRSRPIELWTVQLGFVAWYDSGDAFDDSPELKHAAGAGARILFPQLDRQVLRVDWGFPFVPVEELGITSAWPGAVTFTFGQAFDMPVVSAPAIP